MLKVTYLTLPLREGNELCNVGDRVIFTGVRNILRMALGEHIETIRSVADGEKLPSDADVVVVCGMPQVSQSNTPGIKLQRILEAAQSESPVRLNLGAGSFYFDAFDGDRKNKDAAFANRVVGSLGAVAYREFARFDLCICRDHGAVAALRGLGVDAIGLPCPGFFAPMFQSRPLFRQQGQLVSVLNGTASFWNRVDADVHGFYRRLWESDPTRTFLAHDEQDAEMLSDMGVPHLVFESVEEFLGCLARHERLFSLRVHGALPAWALGLDVTLLGIDRRALIGDDFGARFRVIPVREEKDFTLAEAGDEVGGYQQSFDQRRAWLWYYAGEYVRQIRQVVSRKLKCEFSERLFFGSMSEANVVQPTLSRPAGLYFSKFFYSYESAFPIEAKLFRSAHPFEFSEEEVTIETSSASTTLLYGPYVRIPEGRWRFSGRLELVSTNAAENLSCQLKIRVAKGIPARELGAREFLLGIGGRMEVNFEVDFENRADPGLIETLFSSSGTLPIGERLRLSLMAMKRLG